VTVFPPVQLFRRPAAFGRPAATPTRTAGGGYVHVDTTGPEYYARLEAAERWQAANDTKNAAEHAANVRELWGPTSTQYAAAVRDAERTGAPAAVDAPPCTYPSASTTPPASGPLGPGVDWPAVARHEAAHAVAASYYRLPLAWVVLAPANDPTAAGLTMIAYPTAGAAEEVWHYRRRGVVAAMGPVSDLAAGFDAPTDSSDMRTVEFCGRELARLAPGRTFPSALTTARGLLARADFAGAIAAVAADLFARRGLSGDDVAAIVARF
jgi:hypothetical protein